MHRETLLQILYYAFIHILTYNIHSCCIHIYIHNIIHNCTGSFADRKLSDMYAYPFVAVIIVKCISYNISFHLHHNGHGIRVTIDKII